MRVEAGRDRLGAAAKRSDANEDDNSAGLVPDADFVARFIKRLRSSAIFGQAALVSGKAIVCSAAMTTPSLSTSKS
jgi:hypothetical protein